MRVKMKWDNTVLNEINAKFYCFKCNKELKINLHWYLGHKKVYFFCIPCFKKYESEIKNELG